MKLSQKKICGSCTVYGIVNHECTIGYQTEQILWHEMPIGCKPLEPCPKPLTGQESIEAIKNYSKY